MDDAQLEALLHDIESDRVERKASFANRSGIEEAICAFANDLPGSGHPGVLFIGAQDDGTPSGLAVKDQLLRDLSAIRSDGNILPLPSMSVQKRQLLGAEMAVIVVQPSDFTPVRLRGRAHIRVGPRRGVASPEEERRLTEKRRGRDLPFDSRALPGATITDLDVDLFEHEYLPMAVAADVLADNRRSFEQQLASLRFTTPDGVPSATGMLMVGRDPLAFLAGAYVQFLRLDGVDLAAPIKDEKRFTGPLTQVIREAEETLRLNVSTAVDLASGSQERRWPDVPLVALQQLFRNAVLHRTYEGTNAPVRVTWLSDRIEIQSPGGPFGQVTVESFGQAGITDYRNPALAEALRAVGFIQRFGVGIELARRALADNGSLPLKFVVEPSYVAAIIRTIA